MHEAQQKQQQIVDMNNTIPPYRTFIVAFINGIRVDANEVVLAHSMQFVGEGALAFTQYVPSRSGPIPQMSRVFAPGFWLSVKEDETKRPDLSHLGGDEETLEASSLLLN
jgi:hypothetical protein